MLGIIYYAYGAPKNINDVENYFAHIIGRTPPAPMMAGITKQFADLGQADPITAVTPRLANALQAYVSIQTNEEVKVYNAYKHTAPFLEDVVAQLQEDGITSVVALSVNPIFSQSGAGAFFEQLESLLPASISLTTIKDWHENEAIIALYANRVRQAYDWINGTKKAVLFTVHSQPIDPARNEHYVAQFEAFSKAIAQKANIEHFYPVYRSSNGKKNWLSPDVLEAISTLSADGFDGFVTTELLSIVADVESHFEIGPQAQKRCEELNVSFARSEFPQDSFDTIVAVGNIVLNAIPATLKA